VDFRLPAADDHEGAAELRRSSARDCVTLSVARLARTMKPQSDAENAVSLFRAACAGERAERAAPQAPRRRLPREASLVGDADEDRPRYHNACVSRRNLGCAWPRPACTLANRGVGADPACTCATLLTRVCDRGNAQACFELARLYGRRGA
jgi:hypothetical protein